MRQTSFSFVLQILFLFCICISCENEVPSTYTDIDDKTVRLEFCMESPLSSTVQTRGFGDYNIPPENTRDYLLDGQAFYRITVFLIDLTTQELIGYRDLYPNSEDLSVENVLTSKLQENFYHYECFQKAQISFVNNKPLHGNSETLHVGNKYRLIAAANCTSLQLQLGFKEEVETNEPPVSITYNDYLTNEIAAITTYFNNNPSTGIPLTDYRVYNLFDKVIKLPTPSNICTEEAMPLSFVTDFVLQSGSNRISATLKRVFARIRLALTNTSTTSSLKVSGLKFNKFTQDRTFIFDDPDQPNRKYTEAIDVVPDATSETATKPFAMCIIPPQGTVSIFDGYLPESKFETPYTFNLQLEYISFNLNKNTIVDATELKDAAIYLIYDPQTNRYLKSSDDWNSVQCEQISKGSILGQNADPYLWIFHKNYRNKNGKHRLQSVHTSKFMGFRYELYSNTLDKFVRLDTKSYYYSSDYLYLLLNTEKNAGISISRDVYFYRYHIGNAFIFIDDAGNVTPQEVGQTLERKTIFHFQEVSEGTKSQPREEVITANFKEIKRNDFVQILVKTNFPE